MNSTLSLTTGQNINFTPQGIQIEGEMTLKQWSDFLNTLHSVKDAYHCALADTINYGVENFGEAEVSLALEQAQFDLSDVARATNIGQLTLTFRQTWHLSSEHYFILSKLPEDLQRHHWANITTNENLTALELKRSIEAGKVIKSTEIQRTSGSGTGINTIQGAAFKLQQWEKSMGGVNAIVLLSPAVRKNLLDLLTPTIELAAAIEKSLTE